MPPWNRVTLQRLTFPAKWPSAWLIDWMCSSTVQVLSLQHLPLPCNIKQISNMTTIVTVMSALHYASPFRQERFPAREYIDVVAVLIAGMTSKEDQHDKIAEGVHFFIVWWLNGARRD